TTALFLAGAGSYWLALGEPAAPVKVGRLPRTPGRTPFRATFILANCAAITENMTRQQLEVILGCPPGDYTTGPWEYAPADGGGLFISGFYSAIDRWLDDRGQIMIGFSSWRSKEGNHVVLWTRFRPVRRK